MTKKEAIEYYGTQKKLAAALETNQSTIASWGEYPPPLRQLQIQRITRSALMAEPDVFARRRKAA